MKSPAMRQLPMGQRLQRLQRLRRMLLKMLRKRGQTTPSDRSSVDGEDLFIVLGTDGVFDVLSNQAWSIF